MELHGVGGGKRTRGGEGAGDASIRHGPSLLIRPPSSFTLGMEIHLLRSTCVTDFFTF